MLRLSASDPLVPGGHGMHRVSAVAVAAALTTWPGLQLDAAVQVLESLLMLKSTPAVQSRHVVFPPKVDVHAAKIAVPASQTWQRPQTTFAVEVASFRIYSPVPQIPFTVQTAFCLHSAIWERKGVKKEGGAFVNGNKLSSGTRHQKISKITGRREDSVEAR